MCNSLWLKELQTIRNTQKGIRNTQKGKRNTQKGKRNTQRGKYQLKGTPKRESIKHQKGRFITPKREWITSRLYMEHLKGSG